MVEIRDNNQLNENSFDLCTMLYCNYIYLLSSPHPAPVALPRHVQFPTPARPLGGRQYD